MGDMSVRELSRVTGVTHPTLGRIISGEGNTNLETLEAISKGLDVPAPILLGGTDGTTYDIPNDILESLDGQSPEVFATVRLFLKTLDQKKSKTKSRAKN